MSWPYRNIAYKDLNENIKVCEQIIIQLGGKFVVEYMSKRIYRYRDEYVCVDKICFTEKPFIVLEFADVIEGPYEDSDPFPFDLAKEEMQLEVQYALGLLPYPKLQECTKKNR